MNVLSLRRIHKDHIIGAFQFPQDLRSITLQQCDPVFPACLTEVLFCNRNSFLIFFDRRDMTILRCIFTSRMLFGFVNFSKNFSRLCMDLRMMGTCVSRANFSISFSHAGFPLSRESINADILSSMIILSLISHFTVQLQWYPVSHR